MVNFTEKASAYLTTKYTNVAIHITFLYLLPVFCNDKKDQYPPIEIFFPIVKGITLVDTLQRDNEFHHEYTKYNYHSTLPGTSLMQRFKRTTAPRKIYFQ